MIDKSSKITGKANSGKKKELTALRMRRPNKMMTASGTKMATMTIVVLTAYDGRKKTTIVGILVGTITTTTTTTTTTWV